MHRRLLLGALLSSVCLCWSAIALADDFQITFGAGGDCQLIGGIWISGSQTCILQSLFLDADDQLLIVANVEFLGLTKNLGEIDSSGTVTVNGTLQNRGTLANSGTWFVDNRMLNFDSGSIANQPGGGIITRADALIENSGLLLNQGLMTLQVIETPFERGMLVNLGTMTNQGTLFGNAEFTNIGGLLDNQGTLDNSGLVRDTFIDNSGTINGGTVDDQGPAQSRLINRALGSINGAAHSGISIDNFGTMNGTILGSGTHTNHPGAVMRLAGGTSFQLTNRGLIEIVAPFEMVNNFFNEAGGILLNESTVTNRSLFANHGKIENRGTWTNEGVDIDEGILNNFGTLLNASFIASCLVAPDVEQLNNFGLLSNSGTIAGCGSTNSGTWYECGNGQTPAGDPVVAAVDADADGICGGADCADADPDSWTAPGEVARVELRQPTTGPTQIQWSEVSYLGGNSVTYDLLGATDATDLGGSTTCLATGITILGSTDATVVDPGQVLFILPRATGCASGPTGFDSGFQPRSLPDCP